MYLYRSLNLVYKFLGSDGIDPSILILQLVGKKLATEVYKNK